MRFIIYRPLKGYKYQLKRDASIDCGIHGKSIETEYLKLSLDGTLLVKRGYCWDGPSGISIDTKTFMRGSLFHDAGYQLLRTGLDPEYKDQFDALLKRICLDDGMSSFRAWYVYKAVQLFGGGHIKPKPSTTLVAP